MWSELRSGAVAAIAGVVISCFLPAKSNAWTVTVTGTIFDDIGPPNGGEILNGTGIFGTPGTSLVGDTYTETITTDPSLNSHVELAPANIYAYGGPGFDVGAGAPYGAPYSITVTVNGFTYSQTETNTFINSAALGEGLSNGGNEDSAFQEVESSGCSTVYGVCTSSYILAFSTQTPFVFKLDFHHPLRSNALSQPPPGINPLAGSNTYFVFNNAPENAFTGFYGSIESITVHP